MDFICFELPHNIECEKWLWINEIESSQLPQYVRFCKVKSSDFELVRTRDAKCASCKINVLGMLCSSLYIEINWLFQPVHCDYNN